MNTQETRTVTDPQRRRAAKRFERYTGRVFWFRTAIVAIIDAFVVIGAVRFAENESWAVLALLLISAALINWAYLNPRAQASRWLTPGLVFMAVFVVYPVIYTAYISFTNFQTGNLLSKDQAIERLEEVEVRSDTGSVALDMFVYRNASNELALLVTGDGVDPFFGPMRNVTDEPTVTPLADIDAASFDVTAPPAAIDGYELLSGLAVTAENQRLQTGAIDVPGGGVATVETLTSARLTLGGLRFTYDAATDTLFDAQEDRTCSSGEGTFYCDGVPADDVQTVALNARGSVIECAGGTCDNVPLFALDRTLAGWREVVGADNYVDIFSNERIRGPFVRVLVWNVIFGFGSVFLTFAIGLGLALALKNDDMRFRSIYRSIYIIPYAIPGFLSILVWRGLLNFEFGQVNGLLESIGLPAVNWLGDNLNAQLAVFLVNTWLGFPYMFLICSGALTSIPEELIEAARVDGAGPWKVFRMVTLPLLLVSTAPLLIGSFAYNFNNFLLIFLLTNGGPPLIGYDVPVGATDILISFTFDIAAGSGRGSQFGLASAIVVLIFAVLATTSASSFGLTKKLEEIYDQ